MQTLELIRAILFFQSIGVPIYVHSRIQTNLIMYPTRYNSKISVFNGITVPIFWSDVVSNLRGFAIDVQKSRFPAKIMKRIIYLSTFSKLLLLLDLLITVKQRYGYKKILRNVKHVLIRIITKSLIMFKYESKCFYLHFNQLV